jgi:glutaredoxin
MSATVSETVLLYSKKVDETGPCPFCDKARALLSDWGVPFTEVKLEPYERQALYDDLGLLGSDRTVPQILVKDCEGLEHQIGGYIQLIHSGLKELF